MALDPVKNFAKCLVSTGYASGVTTVVLNGGDGAKLPDPSTDGAFNLVWWNITDYPDPSDDPNKEIIRCTARVTDTLTITRAQEGTSDVNHNTVGKVYKMILGLTKKTIDVLATLAGTETFTNKRITPRVESVASSSTPTPAGDSDDMYKLTALAEAATFGAPTGTSVDGQKLIIRILDNGTARALSWNAIYRAGTDVPLPTTTVLSKTLYCGFIYNSANTKWDLVAVTNNI